MTSLDETTAGAEPYEVPFLPWDQFINNFAWRQGEHVALIGPTGSGKTTLALAILPRRKYVTVLATKPRDSTLRQFGDRNKYRVLRSWDDRGTFLPKGNVDPEKYPKRIVWPDAKKLDAADTQQKVFYDALRCIYIDGGWCVYIDELWYFIHHLKMDKTVKTFLQQSRSLNISLVVATQRPAFVPLEVYDQSTHLFFWRDNDERNLSRLSGISWLSADTIRETVAALRQHEVLHINTRTGVLTRTMSPPPGKVIA